MCVSLGVTQSEQMSSKCNNCVHHSCTRTLIHILFINKVSSVRLFFVTSEIRSERNKNPLPVMHVKLVIYEVNVSFCSCVLLPEFCDPKFRALFAESTVQLKLKSKKQLFLKCPIWFRSSNCCYQGPNQHFIGLPSVTFSENSFLMKTIENSIKAATMEQRMQVQSKNKTLTFVYNLDRGLLRGYMFCLRGCTDIPLYSSIANRFDMSLNKQKILIFVSVFQQSVFCDTLGWMTVTSNKLSVKLLVVLLLRWNDKEQSFVHW